MALPTARGCERRNPASAAYVVVRDRGTWQSVRRTRRRKGGRVGCVVRRAWREAGRGEAGCDCEAVLGVGKKGLTIGGERDWWRRAAEERWVVRVVWILRCFRVLACGLADSSPRSRFLFPATAGLFSSGATVRTVSVFIESPCSAHPVSCAAVMVFFFFSLGMPFGALALAA